jgi:hypothetical protein
MYSSTTLILLLLSVFGAIAQPKIAILGGTERNLGITDLDKAVTDTVIVENIGTGVLHIIDINKTCGCTTAMPDTDAIPAGHSTRIAVRIEPPDLPGDIHKSIALLTNDMSNPSQVVEFIFRVRRSLAFYPSHVMALAGCRYGSGCDTIIKIVNETDTAFTFAAPFIQMPGLHSLMRDTIVVHPHDSIVYKIEFTAPATGFHRGKLKLFSTSKLNPMEEYDVYANVANSDGSMPEEVPLLPRKK